MSDTLRFEGQVAVVSGAGSGIGRAVAMALAQRGAAVVVNDAGESPSETEGTPVKRADAVTQEIVRAGGRAIADLHSIGSHEQARNIVRVAVEAFGRIDILVNNAGIAATGK